MSPFAITLLSTSMQCASADTVITCCCTIQQSFTVSSIQGDLHSFRSLSSSLPPSSIRRQIWHFNRRLWTLMDNTGQSSSAKLTCNNHGNKEEAYNSHKGTLTEYSCWWSERTQNQITIHWGKILYNLEPDRSIISKVRNTDNDVVVEKLMA